MHTLWEYFRISMLLIIASIVCGALAVFGIDELDQRKPPPAIALDTITGEWNAYPFLIRVAGPYRFDLERAPEESTVRLLCELQPAVAGSDCAVHAGRIGIEWQVENDRGGPIVGGNLKLSTGRLHLGSLHWLELGGATMPQGKYFLRIRNNVRDKGAEISWARLRIWRGVHDDIDASETGRRTANYIFASVCALFLTAFAIMLEYVVWKRQRKPQ